MAVKKLNAYFVDSNSEYEKILQDLQHGLKREVSEEVVALVQMKTDEAMEQVWQMLRSRYDDLKKLEDSMPDKPTKEDQNHYLKEFFRLTDPGRVSEDLKKALKFDFIEGDYRKFIDKMKTQEHGEIFKRYLYPISFFNGLREAILHDIGELTSSLKIYTETMGKHAILLNDINKGKREKAFIKGGASLLGMLVGIPFAGAGVGALLGGDDGRKINDSLNKVFNNWNIYIDQFNKFLKILEGNYRLAMMTIYGGTILRVNDHFKALHFTFNEMALLSGHYSLTLTDTERKETEEWFLETIEGIKALIKRKGWKEAVMVSKELFSTMRKRPITARTELYDGKSAIYLAHLYYYIAFQEALLEEYKNGHIQSFYSTVLKLYKELPLLLQEKDIDDDFSSTAELLFRFVKLALKNDKSQDLIVIIDYLKRIDRRFETEGPFIGEVPKTIKEFTKEFGSFIVVDQFIHDYLSIEEIPSENPEPEVHLSRKSLKVLRKIDAEIGMDDEFSSYLKKEYIKTTLMPWRGLSSFKWLGKNKKGIALLLLSILLLFTGIKYSEVINWSKEIITKQNWYNKSVDIDKPDGIPTYEFDMFYRPDLNSAKAYTTQFKAIDAFFQFAGQKDLESLDKLFPANMETEYKRFIIDPIKYSLVDWNKVEYEVIGVSQGVSYGVNCTFPSLDETISMEFVIAKRGSNQFVITSVNYISSIWEAVE